MKLRCPYWSFWPTLIAFFWFSLLFLPFLLLKSPYLFADMGADSIHGTLPIYMGMANNFFKDLGFWSFKIGLGAQTLSNQMFYLDPFNWIFFFLQPHQIQHILIFQQLLKYTFIFWIFLHFFYLAFGNRWGAIVGAWCISLSGYSILWGQFQAFGTAIALSGLSLYCFQRYLRFNNLVPWILSIALFAGFSYYFLFMFSILLFCFAISYYQLAKLDKGFYKTFSPLAVGYLAGLLIAAPILFPAVSVAVNSPRVAGYNIFENYFFDLKYYVAVAIRLFGNAVGSGTSEFYGRSDFGWANYFNVPSVSWGLLGLFMLPFVIFKIFKLQGRLYVGLVALALVFGIVSPIGSSVFHGFSNPTSRWTFAFVIFQVILLVWYLSDRTWLEKITRKQILSTGGILLAILCIVSFGRQYVLGRTVDAHSNIHLSILWAAVFFLVLAGLLLLYRFGKIGKAAFLRTVLSLVIIDGSQTFLIDHYHRDLTKDSTLQSRDTFFADIGEAVKWLKDTDNSFYRISKSFTATGYNDPLAFSFFGTTSYSSLNHRSSVEFFNFVNGVKSSDKVPPNWLFFPSNRALLQKLLAVKYFLTGANELMPDRYFEKLRTFGNIAVWKSHLYDGNAFLYSKWTFDSRKESSFLESDYLLSNYAILGEKPEADLPLQYEVFKAPFRSNLETVNFAGKVGLFNLTKLAGEFPANVTFESTSTDPYIVLNSLQDDYFSELRIKFKLSSDIATVGQFYWTEGTQEFNENQTSRFAIEKAENESYEIVLPTAGIIRRLRVDLGDSKNKLQLQEFSVSGVKVSNYDEVVKSVNSGGQSSMSLRTEGSELIAEGDTAQSGLLVFAIPFDTDWRIYNRDNGPVKTYLAQKGLLAVKVTAGANYFRLDFVPRLWYVSWIAFAIGLVSCLWLSLRRRRGAI